MGNSQTLRDPSTRFARIIADSGDRDRHSNQPSAPAPYRASAWFARREFARDTYKKANEYMDYDDNEY